MKIVAKSIKSKRANVNNIPNTFAFTFVRNWLSDKSYAKVREQYFIGNISSQEINLVMREIKWLAKSYKNLDIITIEDSKGSITQVVL